jgi:phage terminase small subunit
MAKPKPKPKAPEKPKLPKASLTAKQAKFVDEYLVDLNATQAAIRAGFSENSAGAIGSEYLRKPHIAAEVARRRSDESDEAIMSRSEILRELSLLGRSDVRHFEVSDEGHLDLAAGAPDEAWRTVSSVKHRIVTTKSGDVVREVEYRLWSKTEALKMLGTHRGMFTEKHDHTGIPPSLVIVQNGSSPGRS